MKRAGNVFQKIELATISVMLAVMVLVIFVATVGRYTKLYATPWAEELSRYCMAWLCFVGAGYVARHGANFGVDVIVKRLPPKARVAAHILQTLIVTLMCVWIVYYGIQICQTQIKMSRTSPSLNLPMWIVYGIVPFCGLSVGVQNLIYQIEAIRNELRGHSTAGDEESEVEQL